MSPRSAFLSLALALISPLLPAQEADPSLSLKPLAPKPTITTPTDLSNDLIAQAIVKMNANDVDGSLAKLTEAIKTAPANGGAYVLRASIYCQKQQWALAEADFKTAAQISPNNTVVKFQLVELKFMQKQYDAAKLGYLPLEKDPDMGDLAKYKVFLCDLMAGHEAAAKKQLDAFNDSGENPSYYFSNAAWDLYHKNIEDAKGWLISASNIYAPRKNAYYSQSLTDLGYLPLTVK